MLSLILGILLLMAGILLVGAIINSLSSEEDGPNIIPALIITLALILIMIPLLNPGPVVSSREVFAERVISVNNYLISPEGEVITEKNTRKTLDTKAIFSKGVLAENVNSPLYLIEIEDTHTSSNFALFPNRKTQQMILEFRP